MGEIDARRAGKPRRRAYEERAGRKDVKWGPRTVVIGDDVWERLCIDSVRTGKDKSRIVDAVMYEYLRRYVVSDRGRGQAEEAAADPTDPVNLPVRAVAAAESATPPGGELPGEASGQGRGQAGARKKAG